jgi:alkaline phosphatase
VEAEINTYMKEIRQALVAVLLVWLPHLATSGQEYNSSHVFAHNDYVRDVPFFTAYELGVGYIEADVFLRNGKLFVAHDDHEIQPGRTLDSLYLKPLQLQVRLHGGNVYESPAQELTLMIDLKTEGTSTLTAVTEAISQYPELRDARTLRIMISGSVPDPALWENYPSYIYFDGRPGINYTPAQWKRIHMISTSFGQHVKWDGHGQLPREAAKKIRALMKEAHAAGKKFRLWGTPDLENAWRQFMDLKMDVILTDDVVGLVDFIEGI